MSDKLGFSEKLEALVEVAKANGMSIWKDDVEAHFGEYKLTDEQIGLVFDYLLAQKISVKGYLKNDSVVEDTKPVVPLTEEEVQYLRAYEKELEAFGECGPLAAGLRAVVALAKEWNHADVFLGDLIQEGNVGVMLAVNSGEESQEAIMESAKSSMQMLLESQIEVKLQDQKMVDKVNELDEQIQKLTEEMGRKVSIDELSQFIEVSEEEIEDILKLAGEEVGEMDEEE